MRTKTHLILLLIACFAVPPQAGCDSNAPRVVEETDDYSFDEMADRAAAETERHETERHETGDR